MYTTIMGVKMPGNVKSIQEVIADKIPVHITVMYQWTVQSSKVMLNGLIRLPVVNKDKLVGRSYDML